MTVGWLVGVLMILSAQTGYIAP